MTFLKVNQIHTMINQFHILHGVSFEARKGEVTVLLGRNGAGKTTTLKSIMGLLPVSRGEIIFHDEELSHLPPHAIAKKGIGYVPEDQGIFTGLTVGEHFDLLISKNNGGAKERLQWVLDLFPDLKKYYRKKGGALSGGQKQMLSIARAYVKNNDLVLIDEPSKGLAPVIVEKMMNALVEMKEKTTVILVEQNFYMASAIGDCFFIIDEGRTVHQGIMTDLKEDKDLRKHYLGVG